MQLLRRADIDGVHHPLACSALGADIGKTAKDRVGIGIHEYGVDRRPPEPAGPVQIHPAEPGASNAQGQCGGSALLPVLCALLEVAGLETMSSRAEVDRRAPDAAFVVMLFGVEYGLAGNVQPTETDLEKFDLEGSSG